MRTILVIEDEPQIASLVRDYLEHAGFAVLTASDGAGGLALARARRPEAIVLDLGLPKVDGLDVVRALRRDSSVPIVIVTARGDEVDRITGLELGADDYVVKPFSPKELVARVRAVLRRAEATPVTDERIDVGDLRLDLARRRVTAGGRAVQLTPTEFELLATLAREPGRVWTRSQLLDAVHGFSPRVVRAGDRRPYPEPAPQARDRRALDQLRPDGPRGRLRARGAGRVTDADPGPGPDPEPHERYRWERRAHARGAWGPPWARGRGPGPRAGFGFVGCLLLALVVFVGVITALATWLAGVLLGVLSPGSSPPTATAVAVVVVLIVAIAVGVRVFTAAVRPLAELAAATERLADGEPGVRVRPRGPGPVRGLAASFNAMAERLDRSRDDRRALLADVTHELRTPLTVIAGGLEAMLDGVHPMDEDHVSPILAEAARHGPPARRPPHDLARRGGCAAPASGAGRTSSTWRTTCSRASGPSPTRSASGSRAPATPRWRRWSIPSACGRSSSTSSRTPCATPARAGGCRSRSARSRRTRVLTVTDNGEGIAPDELGRVFDRFHRRSDSGGSGLGLTIVRDLATAHGGSVEVESEGVPGRGATFRVRLPRRL